VICEGYTDVMAFALAGAPNAVATCGTALADDHVRALKNLARRVTLAYDADAAGQGAAEQWYRWEHEFDIQVRVADLPAGRDPADVWHDDPGRLVASLEQAEPFLQFRVDRVLARADVETIEGRGRAAEEAAAIVAEHPSELVRDQYAMQLSGRLGITADRLRDEITRVAKGPGRERGPRRPAGDEGSGGASAPEARPVAPREADLLRWAIHEPSVVADWLEPALFLDPIARDAFELLTSRHEFRDALDASEGPVRALLERLAVEEPDDDGEPETLQGRLLVNAVEPPAKRLLAQMVRADEDRASAIKLDLDMLVHAREVGDWDDAREAASRLVGWVVHEAHAHAAGQGLERVEQEA
jgi:DNA primase